MRTGFESLKRGSFLARLQYRLLKLGSALLSSQRRDALRASFCKLVRHRPGFCRRVSEWGLNRSLRTPRIVVSLTSYPKRIKTVHRTIETLLTQTFKPDAVILWLGEEKFPDREKDLPVTLLRLKAFGLTIEWCPDIRSYTKLVPSLRKYPNDVIVTADDDMFYRPDWLERLHASYVKDPDVIHCHLVNEIKVVNDVVQTYPSWSFDRVRGRQTFGNLLMGVCGVLYPPHALAAEVTDEAKFLKLSPAADDLWFWAMAVLNGRKIKLAEEAFCEMVGDCAADNSEALMNIDLGPQCLNDSQLAAILDAYPIVRQRLFESKRQDVMTSKA